MTAIATAQAECALAVERTGSFRRAAMELGVSQPSVSTNVANLERVLGVRLFERVSSGARPTAEGQVLLPHLRAVLGSERTLLREAARVSRREPEPLVISSHRIALVRTVAPLLRLVTEEVGPLSISVHGYDPAQALAATVGERVQLAVTYRTVGRPTTDPRIIERVVSTSRTGLFVPPGHAFENLELITPHDLNDQTMIVLNNRGPSARYAAWYARRASPVVWYAAPDVPSALRLVAEGVGVFLCVKDASVLALELEWRQLSGSPDVASTVIRREGRRLTPPAEMLWQLLVAGRSCDNGSENPVRCAPGSEARRSHSGGPGHCRPVGDAS